MRAAGSAARRLPRPATGRRHSNGADGGLPFRWLVHGVLLMALATGVFGLLPRLGGLGIVAVTLVVAQPTGQRPAPPAGR
jgi:hypothetical protein